MLAPKMMLLKHLRYNSCLHSFLSPRVHIYITSENPFREMGAFQNGSTWTRSDTHAAHMRNASGVIQIRQTRQMQMNKDACIRNWTDEFTSRDHSKPLRQIRLLCFSSVCACVSWFEVEKGSWTDGLNSTVAKVCREFFGAKSFFFGPMLQFSIAMCSDFLLFRLVGWLVVIWYYF